MYGFRRIRPYHIHIHMFRIRNQLLCKFLAYTYLWDFLDKPAAGMDIDAQRRLKADPEYLEGTIDVYPALNPIGLTVADRMIPKLEKDLNRMFPGNRQGGTFDRAAAAVFHSSFDRNNDFPYFIPLFHEMAMLNRRYEHSAAFRTDKFHLTVRGKHGKRMFPGNRQGGTFDRAAAAVIQDLEGADLCIDVHASSRFVKEIPHTALPVHPHEYRKR